MIFLLSFEKSIMVYSTSGDGAQNRPQLSISLEQERDNKQK